jgi:outer membrane protein OmpA-like peptidoglycan-associated protein
MKCRVVQAVLITVLAGIFSQGLAQKNYYVVVGAFSTEGNAKEITTQLPNLNHDTAYAMNQQGHVVQLYVMRTSDEEVALAKSQQLQKTIENAGTLGHEPVLISELPDGRNVTMRKSAATDPVHPETSSSEAASSRSSGFAGANAIPTPLKPKGKLFRFTISDPSGKQLPGKVHFVDLQHERDIAAYNTDGYTDILSPGKSKDLALVCGVFGYKQSEKFVNYSDPSSEAGVYQDENGAWVIPYNLQRLEKGDVSVMYNVAFHKDAVVMLPSSNSDLSELLRMMKENENYEITIHGHCNGNNSRKIISPADNYFDMKGARQFYGSAKELSALRAEAIRGYLVKNGIDPKRIRTFAWGGRYHLVNPQSSVAKLNDRIEIEIRKD